MDGRQHHQRRSGSPVVAPAPTSLQKEDCDGMNETILNTLAEVAITLAGFSGVAVVFGLRGAHSWSPTELRFLWLLISDSFLVLFFSLLPFPLALANWSDDALWGICNALLGSWFIVGDVLALRGERRDRRAQQLITVPVITRSSTSCQ